MIVSELHDEGLEDIKLSIREDTLYLQFEDHAHRGTFRGAATAIQRTAQQHDGLRHFVLVLTDYKMPQLVVRASRREDRWDVSVDRDMELPREKLRGTVVHHPTTGRLDITVYPMVSLVNNSLDHLFDWSVRLAPAFAMNLWQGARLTIQPIFPIAHRLEFYDSKRFIQLGCTNISQQIVSNKRWHVSATAGTFHKERYGLQAKATFHATRTLDIFIDAGLTGAAGYDYYEKRFAFSPTKRPNAMLGLSFYEPRTRLQMELMGGQFVFGDRGARADITRHFGEYAIGIYGILTGGEHNAGFHFAIPFGGRRQKRNGAIRLRLPEYYSMEYSMQAYYKYYLEGMGRTYVVQPDQNHAAHFWQPAFVEQYVNKMLNENFK